MFILIITLYIILRISRSLLHCLACSTTLCLVDIVCSHSITTYIYIYIYTVYIYKQYDFVSSIMIYMYIYEQPV